MYLWRRQPSAMRIAAAVLLSLGLHGLVALALWLAPMHTATSTAAAVDPTQIADDYPPIGLELSSAPPPGPYAPNSPPKRVDSLVQPASFPVTIVDPPRSALGPPAPPTVAAAGGVAASGPASAGGGYGTGGGGPCALPVGKDATTVVYVVDRSISMGFHGALARARREVLASLHRLPSAARFQIIAYNHEAEPLSIAGRTGFLSADDDTLRLVAETVATWRASGGTDDGLALRRGLALQPDVLFLLTDADDLSSDDVRAATRLNRRRTVIHAVQVGAAASRADGSLHRLAADNGGTYIRLDPDE
ncbi:MAG TPA: hypothetical protein VMS17_17975 [Gemmataceae bacterium]|nr:hypothetical protein [Gemmataceae bacterium]